MAADSDAVGLAALGMVFRKAWFSRFSMAMDGSGISELLRPGSYATARKAAEHVSASVRTEGGFFFGSPIG